MATSTTTSTTNAVTTKESRSKQLYLSMPRIPPKVYLKTINPHITCNLCKGYLINATTIVECLHSFCHSCIMMHLRCKDHHDARCPSCQSVINKVKPNIKPDATLQAIVYKLVPGLYEKELLRRRAFYKLRTKEALEATPEQRGDDTEHLIFGPNESISLMLEYSDNENPRHSSDDENSNSSHEIDSSQYENDLEMQLRKPKYLQCPAIFTISNLKKFILHKFSINPNKFCVEIMYKVTLLALPDHYTLMDVAYIFTWKRDAPMKFLYCVRAAHTPATNIEQNAVMYDLPPNRFQTNSQLVCASDSTDQEQDQSSDADSDGQSAKIKQEAEMNGSTAQSTQEEPINSTSDEPSSAPRTSISVVKTVSSTIVSTSAVAGAVTSTSSANTSSKSVSALINGSTSQKKDMSPKVKESSSSSSSSPTTSGRVTSGSSPKSERLSSSPDKQHQDRRSNGTSPRPNTSKSKSTPDVKASASPTRTNQDLKDSKEKVKTKSILTDSTTSKSGDSVLIRAELKSEKTVTFSDKPTPSRANVDGKPYSNIDRPKGRLLFNKEEKAKSLSPPLSAENEYDFDQHLKKEQASEKEQLKTKFLSLVHLTPRAHSTDSPLVQLPKMPKTEQKSETTLPTNLSKDKDNSKVSVTSASTPNQPVVSSSSSCNSSSSSSGSSGCSSSTGTDKQLIKKPENKTSKRKSGFPVKNVTKIKCVSPSDHSDDSKWDPMKSNISSVSPSSPAAIATTSNASSSSTSNSGDRMRRVPQDSSTVAQFLSAISQQNKNHQKSIQSSTFSASKSNQASSSTQKSVFKTPTSTSSKEPATTSTGLKQVQPSTSESETSIIINNVQRPNQADTPRPSMSFKPNLNQQTPFYFPSNFNRGFSNETEIQEIRNDDASQLKVYGPAMSLGKPFELAAQNLSDALIASQYLANRFHHPGKQLASYPLTLPMNPALLALHHQQYNLPLDAFKGNKSKKTTSSDGKKASVLGGYDGKLNAVQNNFNPMRALGVDSNETVKQLSLPYSCKIPSSLSITLTNSNEPEKEAINRSFSTKNSNVVNSIEIVKLPDESSNESNSKFPSPSPSSSNSEKPWQPNKNANNPIKLLANPQNNQIDLVPMSPSFQEQFLQSLHTVESNKSWKKPKPQQSPQQQQQQQQQQQKQSIRPNMNMMDERGQEIQKRKLQQVDDKTVAKVRKLHQSSPSSQQKSSPTTQRPVPDLVIPKDDKQVLSLSSGSSQAKTSANSSNSVENNKTQDRQSSATTANASSSSSSSSLSSTSLASTSDRALTLAVAQAQVKSVANELQASKYSPLQTSTMPIWKTHCTADQMASHKALVENLTQSKKNSGTYVD